MLPLFFFDIHGSVHRKCISKYNQQESTLHNVFISVKCSTCFRWGPPPIIRSSKLYTQHRVLVRLVCHLSLSWKSWNWFQTSSNSYSKYILISQTFEPNSQARIRRWWEDSRRKESGARSFKPIRYLIKCVNIYFLSVHCHLVTIFLVSTC
jgi:hypothetical protein